MRKVRSVLQQNDHKRGTRELQALKRLEFSDILSVGLFTTSSSFCSEFQNSQRNHKSGCKWTHMDGAFTTALQSLHFVQKMGIL